MRRKQTQQQLFPAFESTAKALLDRQHLFVSMRSAYPLDAYSVAYFKAFRPAELHNVSILNQLNLFFSLRIHSQSIAGQHLSTNMKRCLSSLDDYSVSHFKAFTPADLYRLSILKEKLNSEGVISPLNYFNLNKPMIVSLSATVATYIIILLQFKIAEMSE